MVAHWRYIYLAHVSPEALDSYSAPKGGDMQAMTGGARFEDLSYDGVVRDGKLLDGLGQMTDSLTGPNDFELPDPVDTRGKIRDLVAQSFLEAIYLYRHLYSQVLAGWAGTNQ